MKSSFVILFAIASITTALVIDVDPTGKNVINSETLDKQKVILHVFRHIYQPLQHTDFVDIRMESFVNNTDHYTDHKKFNKFLKVYNTGFLQRNAIFNLNNKHHVMELKGLFNLFYYSVDWETMRQNIIWARQNVNEIMFVYALVATILHRKDMNKVYIPSPPEIMPYGFFTGNEIDEAIRHYLVDGTESSSSLIKDDIYMNTEDKLRYFHEDIGFNICHFFKHLEIGFWLDDNVIVGNKIGVVRRGERYLFMYRRMLSRYNLERVSNDLGEIIDIDFNLPIKTGYFSNLRYYNGDVFPMRHNNYLVRQNTKRDELIREITDIERRLRDILVNGEIKMNGGKVVSLNDPKALDILGKIVLGCDDCGIDGSAVGKWPLESLGRILLGGGVWMDGDYSIPSAMEHVETSLRDPVMYQLLKKIANIYWEFMDNFEPYTKDQLLLDGVKINGLEVGKLVTYMDVVSTDITNAVDVSLGKKILTAKTIRINHKPFVLKFDYTSNMERQVVVRLYMGPKFNENGEVLSLEKNQRTMVELDLFVEKLSAGKNFFIRNSNDFSYWNPDSITFTDLYNRVMNTTIDNADKMMDGLKDIYCANPQNILLPRGKIHGKDFIFFVVFSEFIEHDNVPIVETEKRRCGKNVRVIDKLPMGWPFNRKIINEESFLVDNMFVKDVVIFHESKAKDVEIKIQKHNTKPNSLI